MASLEWQLGTVSGIRSETPRVKTIVLDLSRWPDHRPGQHVDLRLTAEDGYRVERSYSIASPPGGDGRLELSVEYVEDGEVSPFLHEVLMVGDRLELRGPIGGYFVWDGSSPDPLLLIAGGSGIVPLMAILRHRHAVGLSIPTTLLYSSRTREEVIYFDELERLAGGDPSLRLLHTLTRGAPPGWQGYDRRIDGQLLAEAVADATESVQVFACGPTRLVEAVAEGLVALGVAAARIRTERFGPSGG